VVNAARQRPEFVARGQRLVDAAADVGRSGIGHDEHGVTACVGVCRTSLISRRAGAHSDGALGHQPGCCAAAIACNSRIAVRRHGLRDVAWHFGLH